jgi:predicted DNA-binding transcriptional regulator YafY
MRADRLISILLLLQMHTRLTARHLAKRLEVSERTIHRDMEALGTAGVPVVADRGVGGGWRLMEGYRANVSGLTESEVQSLFVTRPSRLLADLHLDKASDGALVKLLSVLPAVNRRGAELARQRIHIDVSGWNRSRDPVPHLPALQHAVWSDRRLRMLYDRDGCATERLVDPLGLVAKGSVWYLVGRVENDVRTYRVSRIRDVAILDESFIRPPEFDLAAYWEKSAETFRERLPRFAVVIRARADALPFIQIMTRFGGVDRVEDDERAGWKRVAMHFDAEDVARVTLLGHGTAVEVIEPESLREAIGAEARAVADGSAG